MKYPKGWRYLKDLGQGATGTVVLAKHGQTGIRMALKYAPAAKYDEFLRGEAKMFRLRHPNIARAGKPWREANMVWLALEAGETDLEEALGKAGGQLPVKEVRRVTLEVAQALSYLHGGSAKKNRDPIVHRDVKPANVIQVGDRWKLIDFGLAREAGGRSATITRDTVGGTFEFMPPEAFREGPQSRAPEVDLWALGVLAYRALVGRFWFPDLPQGEDRETTHRAWIEMKENLKARPKVRRDLEGAGADAELVEVIEGLLETDPSRRRSAREVVRTLSRAPAPAARGPGSPPKTYVAPPIALEPRAWVSAPAWRAFGAGLTLASLVAFAAPRVLDWGGLGFAVWAAAPFVAAERVLGSGEGPAKPKMVRLGPGEFWMGSRNENPLADSDEKTPGTGGLRPVKLTRAFELEEVEVTQGRWAEVFGPEARPSSHEGCEECPVENVTWYSALAYANARSRREGLEVCYVLAGSECTGDLESVNRKAGAGTLVCDSATWPQRLDCKGYRLPTEAEWEYASDSTRRYPPVPPLSLTAAETLDDLAWYSENSAGPLAWLFGGTRRTHPVGDKRLGNGLSDMLGNVWEWCWDEYGPYSPPMDDAAIVDPIVSPPGASGLRVLRGGSFGSDARYVRAAFRHWYAPSLRFGHVGFRLARSVVP